MYFKIFIILKIQILVFNYCFFSFRPCRQNGHSIDLGSLQWSVDGTPAKAHQCSCRGGFQQGNVRRRRVYTWYEEFSSLYILRFMVPISMGQANQTSHPSAWVRCCHQSAYLQADIIVSQDALAFLCMLVEGRSWSVSYVVGPSMDSNGLRFGSCFGSILTSYSA